MPVFPQVVFSFFAYGLTTSWLVVVGSVLAQIFTAPPYNFSVAQVGLVAIPRLMRAIIGAFATGPLADWAVKTCRAAAMASTSPSSGSFCLCAIPMYVFGKKCRSWTSRAKIFQVVMKA